MDFAMRSSVIGEAPRTIRLDALEAWYEGNAYHVGLNARRYDWDREFIDENAKQKQRIPIKDRAPKQYNLARHIVDTSASWLFDEEHFPKIAVEDDEGTANWIAALAEAVELEQNWLQLAKQGGSSGTGVALFKIVEGYPCIELLPAKHCLPKFKADKKTLTEVRYQFKAPADYFSELGYEGLDLKKDYWLRKLFTENAEIEYILEEVSSDGSPPKFLYVNEEKTYYHNLGILAAVWIKNIRCRNEIDGESSYAGVVDLFDPINMLLSVAYRSIKKLSDPTVAFEDIEDTADLDEYVKLGSSGGGTVASPGKVKFLEMNGTGQEAAKVWVAELRQAVAEISRVTSNDPEKLSGAAQSGYAMTILHAPLISLVKELRGNYGPALVKFVRLMLEVVAKVQGTENNLIYLPREVKEKFNPSATLSLKWPKFFEPTPQDNKLMLENVIAAVASKTLSLETAQQLIAQMFNIEDVAGELAKIKAEQEDPEASVTDAITKLQGMMEGTKQNEDDEE